MGEARQLRQIRQKVSRRMAGGRLPGLTVLLLTPSGRDSDVISDALQEHGMTARKCTSVPELAELIDPGAGAALIAEEALETSSPGPLLRRLNDQEPWSDFPVLLLSEASRGEDSGWALREMFGDRCSLTLLERPLRTSSLLSAVHTALTSRERQLEMRDLLLEREEANEALRRTNERNRLILESTTDGFLFLNEEFRYETVNRAASSLLGIEREELENQVAWDVFPTEDDEPFGWRFRQAMETQSDVHFDAFLPRAGVWFSVSCYPRAGGLCVFFEDITVRIRTELLLRESDDRFRRAITSANAAIWDFRYGEDGALLPNGQYISPECYRLIGYSPAEAGDDLEGWHSLIHEDDLPFVLAASEEHLRGDTSSFDIIYRMWHKDGSILWMRSSGELERDAEGRPVRWTGIHQDVTSQKERELRLAWLAHVVDSSTDAIYTLSSQLTVLSWNRGAAEAYGYAEEEIRGRSIYMVIPPDRVGTEHDKLQRAMTGSTFQYESMRLSRDGRRHPVSVMLTPVRTDDGTVMALAVIERDTSRLVTALEAVRRSERRFRAVFENAAVGIVLLNTEGEVLEFNTHFCRIAGLSPRRLRRMPISNIHGFPGISLREESTTAIAEAEIRHEDGTTRIVSIAHSPLGMDAAGEAASVLLLEDLTEQQAAAREVRLTRERFEIALKDSPVSVFTHDLGLRYTWVYNSPFPEADSDVIGKRDDELMPGNTGAQELLEWKREALKRREPLRREINLIIGGKPRVAEVMVEPLYGSRNELIGLKGAGFDVTRLKRVENALRTANTDLQAFTSSVSHDLRAPLNATMINADFVLQLIDEGDTGQAAEVASRIQDNVRHMSDMVTGLLKLSRSGRTALKVRTVDTRELVDSLLEDLEDLRQTETEVRVGDLPAVQGDAVLLRSVFQNLIMNAVKFSRASNPPRVEIEWCEDGAEAFFRIRDNGVGFDPAKAEKLFKVFSRLHRQKDYEGTGVGLAIVQRIVSRHGGRVWAESKPGEGASFCFTLGVVEEDG